MFGLSAGKIVLLVLVALVIWMVLRYRGRVRIIREAFKEMQRQAEQATRDAAPKPPVSLRACPICGAYVAADAPTCGRSDCPQGRRGA